MFRVFVRVHMRDFDAFRAFFNRSGGLEERQGWGILRTQIHRSVRDPNDVTLWHDFDSLDDAKSYQHRSRLIDVMAEAGATQVPQIWVTEAL